MSVPVLRLVKSLRYSLNDMQGVLISDFELLETINQAAALLYGRLSERYVHTALKKESITVASGTDCAELPNDFVRVHQVGMDEYNDVADISRMFLADYFKGINSFDYIEQYQTVTAEYTKEILKEVFDEKRCIMSVVKTK